MNKRIVYVVNVDWYFRLHWLERAEYFSSLGNEIHIVSSFKDNEIKRDLTERGFICHNIYLKRKSINALNELVVINKLRKLLSDISPDLIHCVTIKPNIYVGIVNCLFIKAPIIYGITGLGAVFSSERMKFSLLRHFISALYRLISIPYSRFIFENSEDFNFFQNNKIIKHNNGLVIKGAGIDITRFFPSPPPRNRHILFAARLLEDKGLHTLVQAKEILNERGCSFVINVAGIIDTDVSSMIPLCQLEEWESLGLINWLGQIDDMPMLIKEHDMVCLPTAYGEGVPRILIEAASCQRSIVTSDVAGCREIVTHEFNGLLVEPKNPESLADCIQYLLDNVDKLVEFGINGRNKVKNEFSQELVFEKTLRVYTELLLSDKKQ